MMSAKWENALVESHPTKHKSYDDTMQRSTPHENKREGSVLGSEQVPIKFEGRDNIFTSIGSNDVLVGRGYPSVRHIGNVRFRELVQSRKDDYRSTKKQFDKELIAKSIVATIKGRSGNFIRKIDTSEELRRLGLPESPSNSFWVVVDDTDALEKVKQTLRDQQSAFRKKGTSASHSVSFIRAQKKEEAKMNLQSAQSLSLKQSPMVPVSSAILKSQLLRNSPGQPKSSVQSGILSPGDSEYINALERLKSRTAGGLPVTSLSRDILPTTPSSLLNTDAYLAKINADFVRQEELLRIRANQEERMLRERRLRDLERDEAELARLLSEEDRIILQRARSAGLPIDRAIRSPAASLREYQGLQDSIESTIRNVQAREELLRRTLLGESLHPRQGLLGGPLKAASTSQLGDLETRAMNANNLRSLATAPQLGRSISAQMPVLSREAQILGVAREGTALDPSTAAFLKHRREVSDPSITRLPGFLPSDEQLLRSAGLLPPLVSGSVPIGDILEEQRQLLAIAKRR